MKISGIYTITNLANNHKYVGSSENITKRWYAHRYMLRNNIHYNNHLQRAWNKYGQSSLVFEVIEHVDVQFLISREQFFIDTILPEYNESKIAGRLEMTEARKQRLREFMAEWYKTHDSPFKGKKHTEKSKQLISDHHADFAGENGPFYGHHHTAENIAIMSAKKTGENHPFYGKKRPEHSDKMRGDKNPFYGKEHSPETIEHISAANIKFTPAQVEKIKALKSLGISQRQIASMVGLSCPTVSRIINNKQKCLKCKQMALPTHHSNQE